MRYAVKTGPSTFARGRYLWWHGTLRTARLYQRRHDAQSLADDINRYSPKTGAYVVPVALSVYAYDNADC